MPNLSFLVLYLRRLQEQDLVSGETVTPFGWRVAYDLGLVKCKTMPENTDQVSMKTIHATALAVDWHLLFHLVEKWHRSRQASTLVLLSLSIHGVWVNRLHFPQDPFTLPQDALESWGEKNPSRELSRLALLAGIPKIISYEEFKTHTRVHDDGVVDFSGGFWGELECYVSDVLRFDSVRGTFAYQTLGSVQVDKTGSCYTFTFR